MEKGNEILTELLEIAPELAKPAYRISPYTAPEGYFGGFISSLMVRIQWEESAMTGQDAHTETVTISPLLASLRDKNPYEVPAGYFNQLKHKIPFELGSDKLAEIMQAAPESISPVQTSGGGKRIALFPRLIRYAAAACIVALIGLTIFRISGTSSVNDPINSLTAVSDQDMANYLDADDVHWTPTPVSETASLDFSDNDIHELLSTVPDAELENYFPVLNAKNQPIN